MNPQQRLARLVRLVPAGATTAARTPFVLLVVLILGSGLLALLLLNAAVNQGSFRLSKLQKETERLTDEKQSLQQQVDSYSSPVELHRRAAKLGLVPGGTPAFLGPGGDVRGDPEPATGDPRQEER